MKIQELHSRSFSLLPMEEFNPQEEFSSDHVPSRRDLLKKSDSTRKMLQKASSLKNVVMRRSTSENSLALLTEPSGEDSLHEDDIFGSFNESSADFVLGSDMDLFEGHGSNNVEQPSPENPIRWEKHSSRVRRKRRPARGSLSRSRPSRTLSLDDSSSSFIGENLEASERVGSRRASRQRGERPRLVKQTSRRSKRQGRRRSTEDTSTPKDTFQKLELALNPELHKSFSQRGEKVPLPRTSKSSPAINQMTRRPCY